MAKKTAKLSAKERAEKDKCLGVLAAAKLSDDTLIHISVRSWDGYSPKLVYMLRKAKKSGGFTESRYKSLPVELFTIPAFVKANDKANKLVAKRAQEFVDAVPPRNGAEDSDESEADLMAGLDNVMTG